MEWSSESSMFRHVPFRPLSWSSQSLEQTETGNESEQGSGRQGLRPRMQVPSLNLRIRTLTHTHTHTHTHPDRESTGLSAQNPCRCDACAIPRRRCRLLVLEGLLGKGLAPLRPLTPPELQARTADGTSLAPASTVQRHHSADHPRWHWNPSR